MRISRRGVLIGGAVGGGLLVAWYLSPRSFSDPLQPVEGEHNFGAWLRIAEDGVVTVAVPQLEMGQGGTTILPQVVAFELGADWRQVAVEPVPVSGAYANIPLAAKWAPLWMPMLPDLASPPDSLLAERFAQNNRFTATADGTTLAAYEVGCREAAASARAVLAMEAAERWDVSWEECSVENGLVTHGEKSLTFAELVVGAAGREAPDPPPLRPEFAAERPLPGQADAPITHPRLDLPSKVDGSHLFAGDIRLPDMVYAAIKHGPVARESELTAFNASAAHRIPEVVRVVKGKRWLAAVATDWWSADRAVEAMQPRFKASGLVDGQKLEEIIDGKLAKAATHRIWTRGDVPEAPLTKPELAVRYDVSPALHATLETATATARYVDGRLELWMACQAPEQARKAAAKAIGLSLDDVVLYPMPAGGSFDRRLEHDHAIEAALIAREVAKDGGRPVQLVWSRWQEHLASVPRPPVAAMLSARIPHGGEGQIDTLHMRIAAPSTHHEFGARLFDNDTRRAALAASDGEADAMVVEGAMPIYGIPNASVDHVPVSLPLATGRMRGNAHGYTAFFVESFIDEIAHKFSREPLSYRIGMLGGDPRMVACLQQAARLAEWGGGVDQSGQGIACHRIGPDVGGGRIACVATARRDSGGVRVTKLTAAVDIGRIVNLDIARQQVEGGLVFGMGLALGSATGYFDGLPTSQNLSQLDLPLLADCPEIDVEFIASEEDPFDPGELGVAVAAPAIANALFSATGLRFRRLPLISEGL
ncbi:MAG: xanthine dehydrogenase family protein molybdopterin-binding subunit [Sphingomonadaceae bacterium]|nr:xanthine dehydrogenase family protein molybdopterin-binding subunit [Sphingomonadaceae bacterium]MCP5383076.1 xanthine dehydrogenase family protein molybdopterin-binding subunit [Altererythrobacter sp.]MCP5390358.1 xanthine dehydrogenase family protein molybdopterin-binding subunit [Sphingomonadaceae bacterium]MCP5393253.1 xanthine dehydrogenase family protein molybdopterin-binding subunit [Sphingomonadaceae bacterium]